MPPSQARAAISPSSLCSFIHPERPTLPRLSLFLLPDLAGSALLPASSMTATTGSALRAGPRSPAARPRILRRQQPRPSAPRAARPPSAPPVAKGSALGRATAGSGRPCPGRRTAPSHRFSSLSVPLPFLLSLSDFLTSSLTGEWLRSPPAAATCGCKGCGLIRPPPVSGVYSSPSSLSLSLSFSRSFCLSRSLSHSAEPATSSSVGVTGVP